MSFVAAFVANDRAFTPEGLLGVFLILNECTKNESKRTKDFIEWSDGRGDTHDNTYRKSLAHEINRLPKSIADALCCVTFTWRVRKHVSAIALEI